MRQLTLVLFVGIFLTSLPTLFSEKEVSQDRDVSADFNKIVLAAGQHSADSTANQTAIAKQLIASSDCRACHNMQTRAVGPAYKSIAEKYKGDKSATDRLAKKVIAGGRGVWGESMMSAHPGLSLTDATRIVNYILSLSDDAVK